MFLIFFWSWPQSSRKKNTACLNQNMLRALKSPNSCSLPLRCYLPCHILPVPTPQVHRDLPGHQPQPDGQYLYRTRGIFLLTGWQKPASTLYSKPRQFLPLRRGRVSAGAPRDLWRPTQQLLPLLPPPLAPDPAGPENGRPGQDQQSVRGRWSGSYTRHGGVQPRV